MGLVCSFGVLVLNLPITRKQLIMERNGRKLSLKDVIVGCVKVLLTLDKGCIQKVVCVGEGGGGWS